MPLPIESITDEKYNMQRVPFRVYYVPEGKGLEQYADADYRTSIEKDGTGTPIVFLQLTRNPLTKKFVPYAVYYRADSFSDEAILSNPNLAQIGPKCTYCQASNDVADAMATRGEDTGSALQVIQRPVQKSPGVQYMDLGSVVTPSVIPAAIDVFTKVFCEPLGEALVKITFAGLTSIAAGWAAEGGTQASWRKISEDIIRDYKVCPTDIPRIQKNVVAIRDALAKDKTNIMGAMMNGTTKNFGQIAKEHGFEVSADAQIAGRARVSATPFKRGPGMAID